MGDGAQLAEQVFLSYSYWASGLLESLDCLEYENHNKHIISSVSCLSLWLRVVSNPNRKTGKRIS